VWKASFHLRAREAEHSTGSGGGGRERARATSREVRGVLRLCWRASRSAFLLETRREPSHHGGRGELGASEPTNWGTRAMSKGAVYLGNGRKRRESDFSFSSGKLGLQGAAEGT